MSATIKEFYQIKQELEQMTPPGFKIEFCYTWDSELKQERKGDEHLTALMVGKIRGQFDTLWLLAIHTLEELEAFKEMVRSTGQEKSFEPSPVAIAADDYWEESLKTGGFV